MRMQASVGRAPKHTSVHHYVAIFTCHATRPQDPFILAAVATAMKGEDAKLGKAIMAAAKRHHRDYIVETAAAKEREEARQFKLRAARAAEKEAEKAARAAKKAAAKEAEKAVLAEQFLRTFERPRTAAEKAADKAAKKAVDDFVRSKLTGNSSPKAKKKGSRGTRKRATK